MKETDRLYGASEISACDKKEASLKFFLLQAISAIIAKARISSDIMTIGGMSHPCCGVGMVVVATKGGNSAKISVLVVRGKPLGYDLLLGIDAIRALECVATNVERMATKDPSQDMIATVRSSGGGATPHDKSGPNTSITCYRCKFKGDTWDSV